MTFNVNFPLAVARFESALKHFYIKKFLYKTLLRGKGLEFEQYREYREDDDASDIDWKASLRSNSFVVKQYVEEREIGAYVIVDCGQGMLFGSTEKLKAEYNAELTVALSKLIINSRDKVGLIMYNNHVVKDIRPSTTKNQFQIIQKSLIDKNNYGGYFDFKSLISYLVKTLNYKTDSVIIISDFLHIDGSVKPLLAKLSSGFELICLMVRDPVDINLPNINQRIIVQDPVTGKQILMNPHLIRKQYAFHAQKQKQAVLNLFKKSNIDCFDISTDEDFSSDLANFLNKRVKGGGKL